MENIRSKSLSEIPFQKQTQVVVGQQTTCGKATAKLLADVREKYKHLLPPVNKSEPSSLKPWPLAFSIFGLGMVLTFLIELVVYLAK